MKNDSELVKGYLNGEKSDFDLLVARYLRQIHSFFFRALNNTDESSDLTQETFLRVCKNLKKFKQDKNFKVWIFTIAKNLLIDWYRKKKNIVFSKLDTEEEFFEDTLVDIEALPDEIFSNFQDLEKLNEAMENLRPDYKIVILLHHTDDLTFSEIAEILDKPLNTVKSQYHRAILELKSYF
jgi:RNA polymerase sigma-70 factor, ECF subfamily